MLQHFCVKSLRLLTNNPAKVAGMEAIGITVAERVPIHTGHNLHNQAYLAVKAAKMGHMTHGH